MVYKLYDRSVYTGAYVQDAWRLSPRLTMNLGLRWEPYFPFTEELNQFSHFDMDQWNSGVKSTVYRNAPKGVMFTGDQGYPGNAAGRKQLANFAPRVSSAIDVRGDGRTTVRTAWGRFYDLPHLYMFLGFAVAPPLGSAITVNGASFEDPYANVVGGSPFPLTANPNMTFPQFANWLTFPLDMKPWYSDQWNVSVQKQLGTSWAVAANYVNARGHNLPVGENLNPAIYSPGATVANTNQRRKLYLEDPINGQYYGLVIAVKTIGESKYDALLLSLQHRAVRGLTLSTNYTLSKCTTDLVNYEPAMAGRPLIKLGDPGYDRGSCGPADRRHVVNLSTVYQLPELSQGALGMLTNDWQVSAIVRAQTGNFFEVTTGVDNALNGQGNQRANQTLGDPYRKQGYQWLNPAAFAAPAAGQFSSVPIHTYEGPGRFNVDMGITRSFRVSGERQFQLRAEVLAHAHETIEVMVGVSRSWALVVVAIVFVDKGTDAQERDPFLQKLASMPAAFAFEVVRGPQTAIYYHEGSDRGGDPLVVTTYTVRVTHVLKDHPNLGRVGTVVTVGYYGGKTSWNGRVLDHEVADARHFIIGRVYLGFGSFLPEFDRFHLAGRYTFEATPSGLQVFDEGAIEGDPAVDRDIIGRSLPQLIAEIADKRAVARRRVADAAARTVALPVVAWSSSPVSSVYSLVVREVCPGPRRTGTPVIARELALPQWLSVMSASSADVAKAVPVATALVDRLRSLNEARLPDEANSTLGRLTDAATLLELDEVEFFPAFFARYPLASALVRLSPIAFNDTASSALVYCSASYSGLGGHGNLVSLWRVDGAWVIHARLQLWVA